MCYDVKYMTQRQEIYERRFRARFLTPESAPAKMKHYHALGYDHPELPVITNREPEFIEFYQWGLIPSWVKDPKKAVTIQNSTLNARGEELYEKPSFKDAVRRGQRCLIILDGFFEHHHKNGKIYPHYIAMKSGEPFAVGGLWVRWDAIPGHERNTCSIITTRGNHLLSEIHNNPKLEGSRMPFIVPREQESAWIKDDPDPMEFKEMIQPFEHEEMIAYPVRQLRGKNAVGNTELAIEKYNYPELSSQQGSLF